MSKKSCLVQFINLHRGSYMVRDLGFSDLVPNYYATYFNWLGLESET